MLTLLHSKVKKKTPQEFSVSRWLCHVNGLQLINGIFHPLFHTFPSLRYSHRPHHQRSVTFFPLLSSIISFFFFSLRSAPELTFFLPSLLNSLLVALISLPYSNTSLPSRLPLLPSPHPIHFLLILSLL